MIFRLCLLSFHLDVDKKINTQIELRYLQLYPRRLDSQFVNYFSAKLTVFEIEWG